MTAPDTLLELLTGPRTTTEKLPSEYSSTTVTFTGPDANGELDDGSGTNGFMYLTIDGQSYGAIRVSVGADGRKRVELTQYSPETDQQEPVSVMINPEPGGDC